jgi:predicted flap endonuclease-1-like 5' DNA nuclease
MKRRLWIMVFVLVSLILLPGTSALADDGSDGGRVVFGDDFLLEEGERLDGDLAVLGGNVMLEPDSVVDGDLLVMGGSVTAEGEIDGDVVVFGGDVDLRDTASVGGDLVALGGTVTGAEEVVKGKISEGFSFGRLPTIRFPQTATRWRLWSGSGNSVLGWFLRGLRALGSALVLALLGLLAVSLWPKQADLVADTVWRNSSASFGVGFLTYLVVAGLVVLLVITICLSPLLALAAAVAFLFGWVALGWLVGRRLLVALKAKGVAPIWEASLGVFLITLLGAIPCIGWLVWFVGGAFGLGAVVLTRFGTRRYNGASSALQAGALSIEPTTVSEERYPTSSLPDELSSLAADELGDEPTLEALVPETPDVEAMAVEEGAIQGMLEAEDDLELIKGIGPAFAARLREKGIKSFEQLATADAEELAAIVDLFAERVVEDDWIGQAKKMLG